MKILLHVCCAPCAIFPLRILRGRDHEVTGYFNNPNIHPFTEFRRRMDTLQEFAASEKLPLVTEKRYGLTDYLRRVVFHEEQRCSICYAMRLEQAARFAVESGAEAFTSTLLYSRYQNHGMIQQTGEEFARRYGVPFYYEDFRAGWQEGIDRSKAMGLYRQPYCGCIYSEQERYDRKLRKRKKTEETRSA